MQLRNAQNRGELRIPVRLIFKTYEFTFKLDLENLVTCEDFFQGTCIILNIKNSQNWTRIKRASHKAHINRTFEYVSDIWWTSDFHTYFNLSSGSIEATKKINALRCFRANVRTSRRIPRGAVIHERPIKICRGGV